MICSFNQASDAHDELIGMSMSVTRHQQELETRPAAVTTQAPGTPVRWDHFAG
jgi:hypothetical protein